VQVNCIFSDNVRIILQCQKPKKTTAKLSKRAETNVFPTIFGGIFLEVRAHTVTVLLP
jgi:hypothetical protein